MSGISSELDLRTLTADEVITAMLTVDGLRVPASSLRAGDRIIYRRHDMINVSFVESVSPAEHGWMTIATDTGDVWKCSPKNTGQLRVVA